MNGHIPPKDQLPRVRSAWAIPGMDWPRELTWLLLTFAKSKRHAEIGCFGGKSLWASTGRMRDAEVFAVDPLFARMPIMPSREWLRETLLQTIRSIEAGNPSLAVQFLECESTAATGQVSGQLDSVYIDADHCYPAVRADIAAWLPKVRPGGIIAGHDFWPEKFPGVCRAVHEAFGPTGFENPPGTRIWTHHV